MKSLQSSSAKVSCKSIKFNLQFRCIWCPHSSNALLYSATNGSRGYNVRLVVGVSFPPRVLEVCKFKLTESRRRLVNSNANNNNRMNICNSGSVGRAVSNQVIRFIIPPYGTLANSAPDICSRGRPTQTINL